MGELNGIDGLKNQVQQCIQYAYDRGARAEYKEMQDRWEEQKQEWIEQGREETWEFAEKIATMSKDEINQCFGFCSGNYVDAFEMSAAEAIEKIRAWEEKKVEDDNIEIGDEVYVADKDYRKVVIDIIDDRSCRCLSFTGTSVYLIEDLHKTGRRFTEISEILEKMKHGE